MKQTIFTLLLLSSIALVSCRKTGTELNIKQYDQQQILNYIAANHLTGFVQDPTGGDTSGIYYKILQQPTDTTQLANSDNISFVFTLRSFDGLYSSVDTIQNHYQGYLGHIVTDALPYGLELAILNDLKHYGSSIRILIPSHLAYGVNGYGSGSKTVTSSHIAGNQCLDYYVHVINAQHDSTTAVLAASLQKAYDYQVINNYLTSNSITSEYTLDSGVYYRIVTPGKGTDPITFNTTAEITFYGRMLDNIAFNTTLPDSINIELPNQIQGVQRMLEKHGVQGETISMIMPSYLAFGMLPVSGTLTSAPANSCLRYEYTIYTLNP